MKAIGTDVSIRECRASGYVVIYGNPTGAEIDKEECFRITLSNPEAWPDGFCMSGILELPAYIVDDSKSFNDLLEIVDSDYDNVASFADYENCPIEREKPTIYDFLNLASDLVYYYGNNYFSY